MREWRIVTWMNLVEFVVKRALNSLVLLHDLICVAKMLFTGVRRPRDTTPLRWMESDPRIEVNDGTKDTTG